MNLKDKAIDIKGKSYVLVSDRILAFNEDYPNGSIQTQLISSDNSTYVIKAIVCPDVTKPERVFTGYSQAKIGQGMVNQTAALENCETSAVGRALAMMGIGVLDSVASVDEIRKADVQIIREPVNSLEVFCERCNTRMVMKEGVKDGKKWTGYFCPKSTLQDKHPARFI